MGDLSAIIAEAKVMMKGTYALARPRQRRTRIRVVIPPSSLVVGNAGVLQASAVQVCGAIVRVAESDGYMGTSSFGSRWIASARQDICRVLGKAERRTSARESQPYESTSKVSCWIASRWVARGGCCRHQACSSREVGFNSRVVRPSDLAASRRPMLLVDNLCRPGGKLNLPSGPRSSFAPCTYPQPVP